MATQLLESDFLSVDLSAVLKNKTAANKINPQHTTSSEKAVANAKVANFDWQAELTNRLAANKKLDPESRETEYAVEKRFWQEYFTNGWGEAQAKLLMQIGEQLQSDIKELGFNAKNNPILAFLKLNYVKQALIQTRLLNLNTYKALHKAITMSLVADSEFFNATDYNIIYCRDLYTKPATDIIKYLEAQKYNLPINVPEYTKEMQDKNKRIFLWLDKNTGTTLADQAKKQMSLSYKKLPSVKDKEAKLNDLDLVYIIQPVSNKKQETKNTQSNNTKTNKAAISKLLNEIDSPAEVLATMQYLSIATGSEKALDALTDRRLREVSAIDLMQATTKLARLLTKTKLDADSINTFTELVLAKLSR